LQGKPFFGQYTAMANTESIGKEIEKLKGVAVVPINFQGKVIGSLNLASHNIENISPVVQQAIEAIAARIGSVISRFKTEETRQESEDRYRLLFKQSPLGIFQYDTRLVVNDNNDRLATLLGSSREKLTGLDLNKITDQRIVPALRIALEGKEGTYEGEYIPTTGNLTIWAAMKTSPLFDKSGKVSGGIAIVEDISNRKKSDEAVEDKVRELEDFHKLAVGRELKMIDYEKEVNALLKELGREAKYGD